MPRSPAYSKYKKDEKKCNKKGKRANPITGKCIKMGSKTAEKMKSPKSREQMKALNYKDREVRKIVKSFKKPEKVLKGCYLDLEKSKKRAEKYKRLYEELRASEPKKKRAKIETAAAAAAVSVASAVKDGIITQAQAPRAAAQAAAIAAAAPGTQIKQNVKAAASVVAKIADVNLTQRKIEDLTKEVGKKPIGQLVQEARDFVPVEGFEKAAARVAAQKHPFTTRRVAKRGQCAKFVFVLGAGASASAPASIPTFRGTTGKTSDILQAAIRAAQKYYPKIVSDTEQGELVVVVGKSGVPQSRLPWSSVFTERFRTKYPKIINGIWKYWIDMLAGKHPNLAHLVAADLHKRGLLNRLVTMNVDNLEYAAGLPMDAVILQHGSAFVGRDHKTGRIMGYDSSKNISSEDTTSIVTVGGVSLPDDDMIKDYLIPDIEGECLVLIGISGNIIPDWIFKSKPGHIIIVNPSQGAVNHIMEGFPKSMRENDKLWDVYETMEEFVDEFVPNFIAPQRTLSNSDKKAIDMAKEWVSNFAADFPF